MSTGPIDWAILYADRSVVTSLDCEPWEAPRHGVQQTFYCDPDTGVGVESSLIGHWVWKQNRWFGCDDHMGFWDYMFHHPEPCICLFGRTLHNDVWEQDIRDKAIEICGWPKSAWRPRERRP